MGEYARHNLLQNFKKSKFYLVIIIPSFFSYRSYILPLA